MTIERVLNSHWWAKALLDRRALDITKHSSERAHQKVDSDGVDPHFNDHELTSWEREWIQARISDAHYHHAHLGDAGIEMLKEPLEAHEARELDARAIAYFDATHQETRAKLIAKRAAHQKAHANAHMLKHRPDPNGPLVPIDSEAVAAIREGHTLSIEQIDGYIAPGGLIDRHVETVKASVAEARRLAQKAIDDAELILSVPFAEHVATWHQKVRDEIRASAPPPPLLA